MFFARWIFVTVVVGVVMLVPVGVSAFGNNPPVSVQSCAVHADNNAAAAFLSPFNPIPWLSTDLLLSFVNNTPLSATHVEFLITYDGQIDRVESFGTFAPGTRVYRTTSLPPFIDPSHVSCSVARVDFGDGSSWNAGSPARKTARRAL
jgi:hypothetical protein